MRRPGLELRRARQGEMRIPPVSVCHQVSTTGPAAIAYDAVIPFPSFRIDGLADRTQKTKRSAARFLHRLLARAHERPWDSGRRGVVC